jgi:S-adenosylmethionine-diacylgycerolhomoserine-N-methlytransferase
MGLAADLRILYHMAVAPLTTGSLAERLDALYRHQADDFDDFRRRLLHGREEMMRGLEVPAGGRLLDMGGGTGSNLEYLADRLSQLHSVTLVDLCPSLLRVAEERIRRHGWNNVRTVQADATTYEPLEVPVDVVTFSYSLTMIPDWFRAIDQVYRLLRRGGRIGVVDYYVSRKWPAAGQRKHARWQRFFWPYWFSWENVFPSADHLPFLQSRFATIRLEERLGRMPYMPLVRAPYYLFVGCKV